MQQPQFVTGGSVSQQEGKLLDGRCLLASPGQPPWGCSTFPGGQGRSPAALGQGWGPHPIHPHILPPFLPVWLSFPAGISSVATEIWVKEQDLQKPAATPNFYFRTNLYSAQAVTAVEAGMEAIDPARLWARTLWPGASASRRETVCTYSFGRLHREVKFTLQIMAMEGMRAFCSIIILTHVY